MNKKEVDYNNLKNIQETIPGDITIINGKSSWNEDHEPKGHHKYVWENNLMELCLGYILSDSGDRGWGFSYESSRALFITIDKNYRVKHVRTDSYRNDKYKEIVANAEMIANKIKLGCKLVIEDEELVSNLNKMFDFYNTHGNLPYMVGFQVDTDCRNHMFDLAIKNNKKMLEKHKDTVT